MWDPGPAWNKFFQTEGKATHGYYGTWGNYSVFDADAVLHPLYHTEPGGWVGKWYARVEGLDKLIDEARSSVDQSKRKRIYTQIQQMIREEAPSIFLWTQYDTLGISKKVQYAARGTSGSGSTTPSRPPGREAVAGVRSRRIVVFTVLVRRAVRLVVVLVGVSLVTFAILHVSGDPVVAHDAGGAGGRPGGAPAVHGVQRPASRAVRPLRGQHRPGRLRPVLLPPRAGAAAGAGAHADHRCSSTVLAMAAVPRHRAARSAS